MEEEDQQQQKTFGDSHVLARTVLPMDYGAGPRVNDLDVFWSPMISVEPMCKESSRFRVL